MMEIKNNQMQESTERIINRIFDALSQSTVFIWEDQNGEQKKIILDLNNFTHVLGIQYTNFPKTTSAVSLLTFIKEQGIKEYYKRAKTPRSRGILKRRILALLEPFRVDALPPTHICYSDLEEDRQFDAGFLFGYIKNTSLPNSKYIFWSKHKETKVFITPMLITKNSAQHEVLQQATRTLLKKPKNIQSFVL